MPAFARFLRPTPFLATAIALFGPFSLAVPVCAQTPVNLSGVVLDTAGSPVAGVTVALERDGRAVTSGTDGSFVLGSATALGGGLSREGDAGVVAGLRDGYLYLSLAHGGVVLVTAHAPDGRTVSAARHELGVGSHRVAVPVSGSGVRFYRVTAEGRTQVVRAIELPGMARGALTTTVAASSESSTGALAKVTAGVPFYDQITAVKTGYLKSYVAIRSSDSTGLTIRMLPSAYPKFSFFVTSLKAMQDFSGSQNGFGGDFRFGETGAGAGLRGADKLCATIAERSLKHSSFKGWRAFLSVKQDAWGQQADAIDRVGPGPWYDRVGRVMAPTKADLLAQRPTNGDVAIRNDLPNEDGIPNQRPDPNLPAVDNHHTLTGSTTTGTLYNPNSSTSTTCADWTTKEPVVGVRPRTGWSWSIQNRIHWISGSDEGGCGAGINLVQNGGAQPNNPIVGSGGGYGGYYCFALNP